MNRVEKILAMSCLFLTVMMAGVAWGESGTLPPAEEEPVQLQEMSVTGDWLGVGEERKVKSYPGARSVIREQVLKESGAESVRDVLRRLPGVQVQKNSFSGSSDFSLNVGVRGLPPRLSPRSTVLQDGIPLAVAPYGQPQLSLAPLALGNLAGIDVVRGGGSVRFGPQNVGGIINFITKPIPYEPTAELRLRGSGFTEGPADLFSQGRFDALVGGTTSGGLGAALLYSGKRGDGYREHSDTAYDDLNLKFSHFFTDDIELSGKLHYFRGESDLPGGLSSAEFDADRIQSVRPFDRFEGDRKEAALKYKQYLGGTQALELTTFYNESFREATLANKGEGSMTRLDRLPRNYRVFAVEPRYSVFIDGGALSQEWSVGYRYLNEDADEKRERRSGFAAGGDPFGPDATVTVNRDSDNKTRAHAAYIDNRIEFGKFSVTPGVRYENVEIDRRNNLTGFKETVDFDELLPSVNVLYRATPALGVYANFNTSFGSVQHLQLNLQEKANTLNPEKAHTYELGSRYDDRGWSAEATVFLLDFKDQLEYDGTLGAWANRGKTLHRGFEGRLQYDFAAWGGGLSGLSLYGTYTYTRATREEGEFDGKEVPFVSEHTATTGLRYQAQRWTLSLDGFAQSEQFADAANTVAESDDGKTGRIPGYALWNLRAARAIGAERVPVELAVGMNNLFDKEHFTRSTDTNGGIFAGEPRSVYVELSAKF